MSKHSAQHYKSEKRQIDSSKLVALVALVISGLTALATFLAFLSSHVANENNILFEKPSINLSVDYADEQSSYINKIAVEINNQSVEHAEIKVEPFLNIIFFLPNEKRLVKEILPIYDLEQVNLDLIPYKIEYFNTSQGKFAEVSLNDNSYSIINNFYDFCINNFYLESYDKILPNIFGEYILTSISLEMYIVIDYSDKLNNNYKDIYWCTTGYHGFTKNVVDTMRQDTTYISDEIVKYNIECVVVYFGLKTYMKNPEFNAGLEKIQQGDIFFEALNEHFLDIVHKANTIDYVVAFNEQLEKLIYDAYTQKQLLFTLSYDEPYWKIWQ